MRFYEIHKELYSVLPFVMTSIGYDVQHAINRPNGFDSHHFLWVTEGIGKFFVDGEAFTLSRGEGIFMRDDVPHRYGSSDFSTAYITFTMDKSALDYLSTSRWFRFTLPAFLEKDFEHLCQFSVGNSTILSRSSAGYAFVMDLFSHTLATQDSTAARIDRFLEQCYAQPLTLDEIAEQAGMSRFALCHYYQKERGITVMDSLLRIRIEKAKRFLKYSTDSVHRVGVSCGFESTSYFGKRFRETVGCTPTEYRKRYGESVVSKK